MFQWRHSKQPSYKKNVLLPFAIDKIILFKELVWIVKLKKYISQNIFITIIDIIIIY